METVCGHEVGFFTLLFRDLFKRQTIDIPHLCGSSLISYLLLYPYVKRRPRNMKLESGTDSPFLPASWFETHVHIRI